MSKNEQKIISFIMAKLEQAKKIERYPFYWMGYFHEKENKNLLTEEEYIFWINHEGKCIREYTGGYEKEFLLCQDRCFQCYKEINHRKDIVTYFPDDNPSSINIFCSKECVKQIDDFYRWQFLDKATRIFGYSLSDDHIAILENYFDNYPDEEKWRHEEMLSDVKNKKLLS